MNENPPSGPLDLEERRVYVLAPVSEQAGGGQQGGMLMYDLLIALWQGRWIILAATLLGGILGFASAKMSPIVYESTATLLIQPPQFSSDLKPAPLSVVAYQSLLESDYIANEVRRDLQETNLLPPDMKLKSLKGMVSTEIPAVTISRMALDNLPMILVKARASSPEMAAEVANAYAQVFTRNSLEVATRGREGAMKLIEDQYPVTEQMLEDASTTLKEKEDEFSERLLTLNEKWDGRISKYKQETEELTLAHERESKRLLLEFNEGQQPEVLESTLTRKKDRLVSLQGELEDTRMTLKSSMDVLNELQRQIKTEPRFVVLSKAITDSALWIRLGEDSKGELPEALKDETLASQQPNPIHEKIMKDLIDAQVSVERLKPRESDLREEIDNVRKEIDELSARVSQIRLEEFDLRQKRQLSLLTLKEDRQRQLNRMESIKNNELGAFSRARQLEIEGLMQKKMAIAASFDVFSNKYESVRLARSEDEPDVKIGAFALAPEQPVPAATLLKTLVGLMGGLLLSIFVLSLKEAIAPLRLRYPPHQDRTPTQLRDGLAKKLVRS